MINSYGLKRGVVNNTVKSGYYIMKETKEGKDNIGPSSSFKVDSKLWKEIWKMGVPNKIKHFIWRLCTNSLATNANMFQRKVRNDRICSICWKESETVEHLCFLCDWTMLVWSGDIWG